MTQSWAMTGAAATVAPQLTVAAAAGGGAVRTCSLVSPALLTAPDLKSCVLQYAILRIASRKQP